MESPAKTPSSLSLPWKTRIFLWLLDTGIGLITRRDGTVNRRLFNLVDFRVPPSLDPINGVKTYDVTVDPTRKLWFRAYVPTQHALEDLPVMVFFHGGAYILLSPDTKMYNDVCRKFARGLPAVVVSVDYRLAPEHRHPAQHEDGFDVLRFLDVEENRAKWLPKNANISRCFVAGDSAGGHLAHHVTLRAAQFNFNQLRVIGLVSLLPLFGGEDRTDSEIRLHGMPIVTIEKTDWYWNAFMPLGQPFNRDHPVINVSGPNAADISKLDFPATMVVVAGFDSLIDRQIRYYEWLKKSGKEVYLMDYPNMFHPFYIFPELPESDQVMFEMKDFINKIMNRK